MVKDLFDMSRVLSGKLGKLPDPTLNPGNDMAYQFPGAWRSLVKLCMSERVDMDQSATAVDPSDVRLEQLDGEDIEYQCDECPRVFTTYGGLTAHQAHQHGKVDWTRRYVESTCFLCAVVSIRHA